MNAKKQTSLEQLFRLYPQLRPQACSEPGRDEGQHVAAEAERRHAMAASAATAGCMREA